MILEVLQTGPLMVNTYVVGDEGAREAGVFDPGGEPHLILKVLEDRMLSLKYIFNTHTHWDHVGADQPLHEATGAPILAHWKEAEGLKLAHRRAAGFGLSMEGAEVTRFIQEGDRISVGSVLFEVLDLRGHSPGGLGFVFEAETVWRGQRARRHLVICGDALFAGSIGRTDLPGGDMELLLHNIRTKIFSLPDDTLVLPGHGPITTVGEERRSNPFFR